MKTLAIDCRMARMSGIGVYLRHLAPLCMQMLAGSVRFALLGHDGAFDIPEGVAFRNVPLDAPIYNIREQYRILPLLRGCDALWLPHYPIPVLSRLPLVVTVHDVAHLALPDIFTLPQKAYARLMFQAVRRKAAELLFVSRFSQREFLRLVGTPSGRMTVAPNGVDPQWFEPLPSEAPLAGPYFLAIGNIKPHKNIRLLCQAFSRIATSCNATLILAGEYSGFRSRESPVESLAAICPGGIRFAGPVGQDELRRLMHGATALVFPSRYEGFGLPPLEALAAGIPVIASDIPPVREVCGEFAFYVSPGSVEQLAQRMLEVLGLSGDARYRLGMAGQAHARQFRWEKSAEITAQVLARALS